MKLSFIMESADGLYFGPTEIAILSNPRLDQPGRKTRAHTQYSKLLMELIANKVPVDRPPNVDQLVRIKTGYGPDKFSIYYNNNEVYIAQWDDAKQYWFRTGIRR